MHNSKLLIVSNPLYWQQGGFYRAAAADIGIEAEVVDVRKAYAGPQLLARIWYRLFRSPLSIKKFSREVLATCNQTAPEVLLSVGITPVLAKTLESVGRDGIRRIAYLTDDPWSQNWRSSWVYEALLHYDQVFSPRRAAVADLQRLGCRNVEFLPFAFSPDLFYPDPPRTEEEKQRYACDLAIIANADQDRVPYAQAMLASGLNVRFYANGWERFVPETRPYCRGSVIGPDFRKAACGAKVHVSPVRHSNRDGHAMRSMELASCGVCEIIEDTSEHRELFGDEGQVVCYYKNMDEMIEKARALVQNDAERERLSRAALQWAQTSHNTYKDRLIHMLDAAGMRTRSVEPG